MKPELVAKATSPLGLLFLDCCAQHFALSIRPASGGRQINRFTSESRADRASQFIDTLAGRCDGVNRCIFNRRYIRCI